MIASPAAHGGQSLRKGGLTDRNILRSIGLLAVKTYGRKARKYIMIYYAWLTVISAPDGSQQVDPFN